MLSPSRGLLKVCSFAFLFVLSALKILGNFTKLRVIAWVLFWCLHILLPVRRPWPYWALRQQLHVDSGWDSQKQNRFAGTTTPEHNLLSTGLQHPTSPLQHCSSVISSFVVVLRQPCCWVPEEGDLNFWENSSSSSISFSSSPGGLWVLANGKCVGTGCLSGRKKERKKNPYGYI